MGKLRTTDVSSGSGTGTVTTVSVATANGVSGTVANPTTTPAITLSLAAITPTTVNGVTVSGSSIPTLAVTGTTTVSGSNTGDQTSVSGNAGTVTTNANLTGPITSSGNATAVASQTGTGSKFVMDTSPALVTPNLGTPTALTLTNATGLPESGVTNLTTDLGLKAPLASPTFTGTVTVPTTTNATDAASKSYVDGVAQGLSVKASVQEATAAALPTNTYLAGVITVTATGTLTVDGQLVALNDRVLVKNEVAGANNGIYLCTTAGAVGVAAVLTRATDSDTGAEILGAFVFVEKGTANASSGFVNTNTTAPTIGTTAITYTQFSGAGEITASTGLTKSGNTLTIDTSVTVDKTTTQTLSGKTLTSPTLTTPAIGAATGTSLSVSGQLTSTVAIGTAPLVVTSTTNVPNLNADTVDGMHGSEVAPVGSMTMFAGSAAPGGWLICDGSSLLRTSYAALFTVIGTTFGTVDGTHFTLPDMRGRTPLGVGTSTATGATAHTLGQVGGEETHTMTTAELVSHSHSVGIGGANTNFSPVAGTGIGTTNTAQISGLTGSTTPFNELPPYVGLNYIIKSQ